MSDLDHEARVPDEAPSPEPSMIERVAAAFSDFESIAPEVAAGQGL